MKKEIDEMNPQSPFAYKTMQQKDLPDRIAEPRVNYGTGAEKGKRQGEYTLEEYYALPEEQRSELIDGVFYDMAAPGGVHQTISAMMVTQIVNYVLDRNGDCLPLSAPLDVQLDCDERTMVQPDILILCDRDKMKEGVIYGAPDFVAEIFSPSTKRKDMHIKLPKYKNAGVREYWMIDPEKKQIIVYDFESKEMTNTPAVYGFQDQIPIRIYNGDCEIDFSIIDQWVDKL